MIFLFSASHGPEPGSSNQFTGFRAPRQSAGEFQELGGGFQGQEEGFQGHGAGAQFQGQGAGAEFTQLQDYGDYGYDEQVSFGGDEDGFGAEQDYNY